MKKISPFILLALVGSLFTGCANYSEKIVFASDPAPYQPPAPPPVATTGLTRAEVAQVEREILGQLLQRDLENAGDYSAIFLQTDERQTKFLQQKFPRHNPPIKQLWHAEIQAGRSPFDKDTGRNALVLSAETMDPENGVVTSIGRWSAGEAVKGFRVYKLQKSGAEWLVQMAP